MNEIIAKEFRNLMQNPLFGESIEHEHINDFKMRNLFFNALYKV